MRKRLARSYRRLATRARSGPGAYLRVYGIALLLGVALLALSARLGQEFYGRLAFDIGAGILAAVALLILVEIRGRREDIFRALGFSMPEGLRDQLGHLANQKILCEESEDRFKIAPDGIGRVRVERRLRRKLVNKSHSAVVIPELTYEVAHWIPDAPSNIEEFRWRVGAGPWTTADPRSFQERGPKKAPGQALRLKAPAWLDPGMDLTWEASSTEFRRPNDTYIVNFHYATKDPRILLELDPGLRGRPKIPFLGPERRNGDSWAWAGMLMPRQAITVRWWPVAEETPADSAGQSEASEPTAS